MWCKICKERGSEQAYEGETCRNMYLRGLEHEDLFKKEDKNSVIFRHAKKVHEKEIKNVEFGMKIVKTFTKPISRIINEGIRIKNRDINTLLNTKHEYFGPSVKKRVIENSIECDECGYRFGNNAALKSHKYKEHENKKVECDLCGKQYDK